jgi:hypothetical protein
MALLVRAPQEVTEPDFSAFPASTERFPIGVVVAAMVASIALRARFVNTPLTSDEGGYLAVARSWASGRRLYTDAWVDRPQGLVVLYRVWDDITGGSTAAIRIMAILFGCIAVVAVAYAVFALAGARAAGVAAILVAVASANARIEGFIANGELLAGAVGAASVAIACAYLFRGRGRSWLFASGLVAGIAISLKQSGCDGFLAVMLCVIAGGVTRERTWREVGRECTAVLAGLACVLAVLFLHGLVVGFRAWWYAVAGYRLQGINATSRADWHRFGTTGLLAAPTIVPLAIAAIGGLAFWVARSRSVTRATLLIPAWICCAVITFLAGGLFHRHYWVTLTFPLAAAAAVAVGRVGRPAVLILIAGLLALPSLISTVQVVKLDRAAAGLLASDDPRSLTNERIAAWYDEHRVPGSTLYAMCASAALYANADALPPYPYLWQDGVLNGKGAQDDLVQLFAGDAPPTYVVEFQNAASCNPGGQIVGLLRQRYTELETVDGLRILMLHAGLAEPASAVSGHSQ